MEEMMRIYVAILLVIFCMHPVQAQEYIPRALQGIDTIPFSALQLSDKQMQNVFVISDQQRDDGHASAVREAGCKSYVVPCDDHNNLLTTPFTFLYGDKNQIVKRVRTMKGKILTVSSSLIGGKDFYASTYGAMLPFVVVAGAGNDRSDNAFEDAGVRYDRSRSTFVHEDGQVVDHHSNLGRQLYNVREAVEAQKVIYAASYSTDQGRPVRTSYSTGCVGVEESCVFLPEEKVQGGTSLASPILGSTMASLLAVFPSYDVFDLAALVNSCAKQFPSIIGGIVDVPCMIETICEETGSTSSACAVEQPGPTVARHDIGWLENPLADPNLIYSERSGISAISGWVCDADEITIELNGTSYRAGYGTIRTDTESVCGDSDNGFSLLWNWNSLGDGIHTVRAYADGELFASTQVKVVTLGGEFRRDIKPGSGAFIPDFPDEGDSIALQWEQSLQNFVITDGIDIPKTGYNRVPGIRGVLGNPSLGSTQSGISAISGWVCDAEEITIELNGVSYRAGYGTIRTDTESVCGDSDNGFSLLWNWNSLGDGIHTIRAYADGELFASTQVKVVTLGGEFLSDLGRKDLVPFHTRDGQRETVRVEWHETLQNFVVVRHSLGHIIPRY